MESIQMLCVQNIVLWNHSEPKTVELFVRNNRILDRANCLRKFQHKQKRKLSENITNQSIYSIDCSQISQYNQTLGQEKKTQKQQLFRIFVILLCKWKESKE